MYFHWALTADRDTVAQGAFSPDCRQRSTAVHQLVLPLTKREQSKVCLLHFDIADAQGLVFHQQSVRLNPVSLVNRLLSELQVSTAHPTEMIQEGFLVRAGRKATMGERLKVGDKRLEKYLLRLTPEGRGKLAGGKAAFLAGGDTTFHVSAEIDQQQEGNATHVRFILHPDSTDTFLSEFGLAMLLDPRIDRVQWIGQGMMPTYPGRYRAGRYGFWALQKDDLYFEGNRMGVDAAMLTDAKGDGLLLFCRQGCVSFEQTDRGIVLSYNAAVAGQGPKFARTAFPVVASQLGSVSGDFYLYRVDSRQWPSILESLFVRPSEVPSPFHPFLTQYDTYLMRYGDIVSESPLK